MCPLDSVRCALPVSNITYTLIRNTLVGQIKSENQKKTQNKTLKGFHTVGGEEDGPSESVTVIVTGVVEKVVEVGPSSMLCTVVKSRTKIGKRSKSDDLG